MSLPAPAYTLSLPSAGMILSLPRLPQRRSLPRPPQTRSAPRLPLRWSAPRRPLRRSSPSRPVSLSSLSVPTSLSSPAVPVRTLARTSCPTNNAPNITTITVSKMYSRLIVLPPLAYVELILPPLRPFGPAPPARRRPVARYYASEQRVKPEGFLGRLGGAQHLVVVVSTHTNGQEVSEDEVLKRRAQTRRPECGRKLDPDQSPAIRVRVID